nr:phage portal protein [Levilactobacillus brevis]
MTQWTTPCQRRLMTLITSGQPFFISRGVAELTPEQKETIRKWHIFQIPDTVMMTENATQKFDVHYLDKPDGDNVQENAIKHLTHQVYDTAQVTNMNDPDFC